MKATLKKEEGLTREFEVQISAKDIEAKKNAEFTRLSKEAKIDGFRKGKIPVAVIKKKYEPSVNAEVLDKLVQESLYKTIEDNKLRPVLEPSISNADKFEDGKDFKYNFSVEIFPEVPKIDYSKVTVVKEVAEVDDAAIEDALGRVGMSNKQFKAIKEKRKTKNGDTVVFDFLGQKDGVPFDGGKAEDFKLELGSGQFIPGFEPEMVGMDIGEEKTFPITFPEEYHSPDLAGQKVEFTVNIKEIQEETEASFDDDFAKQFGMESMDEMRKAVSEQIEKDFEAISFTKAKKSLFDELDAKCKFDVPPGMVQLDQNQVEAQIKQEEPEKKDEDVKKEAYKLAERRVRLGILLSEIGSENKLSSTEDEIRQLIFQKAQAYPGQESQILEFYQKNPNAQEQIRGEIIEDKAVRFLLGKVKVDEKKVSKDELLTEEGHVHDENCGHEEGKKQTKKVADKKPAAKKTTTKKKK